MTRGVEVRSVDMQAELPLPTTDTRALEGKRRALEETARMERERRAVQVGAPHSPSPPRPQHPPHPPLTQEERRRLEQVRRQEAAAYQEKMEGEARRGLDQEYRGKREEMLRASEEVEALLGLLAAHHDQLSAALGNLDTEYQGLAAAPLHPTQLPALATPLPPPPATPHDGLLHLLRSLGPSPGLRPAPLPHFVAASSQPPAPGARAPSPPKAALRATAPPTARAPARRGQAALAARLCTAFPSLTMAAAMEYVEEVRRSNGGSLSGLPVIEIEGRVRELLEEVQALALQTLGPAALEVQGAAALPLEVEGEECAICLGEMAALDALRTLACGHYYHTPCIQVNLEGL